MDLTIARVQGELEQAQLENQELRMRRPPRNLAPIQQDQQPMMDMDGQEQQYQQDDGQDDPNYHQMGNMDGMDGQHNDGLDD